MDRVIPRIRQLIATPSVSRVDPALDQGNRAVTELLAGWLADEGWTVQIVPLSQTPPKANLIATLGRGSGGLALAGHTDTVPHDSEGWHHDPFRASEVGGRIYGLGSADMKSFFALALEATHGLRPDQLQRPLTLIATADEEISMGGARALLAEGVPHARYALIGEPTGLRPVRMHKGMMMQRIRLRGRSGHSSNPALGASALEGMHGVIEEMLAWRGELQSRHRNPLFSVPVPTLNLGHIHGGDNPNRICGTCEMCFDLRPLPGMDLDELRGALGQRLSQRLDQSELTLEIEDIYPGTPPMSTEASSRIVQVAAQLSGYEPTTVAFATEAPYYQRLGMQPVVMGPGRIEQAHQPDEYIEISSFAPTIEVLRGLIKAFCIDTQEQARP